MKKLTLLLLLAMIGVSAWAVPARKGEITHRQKDGTQLTLRLEGDEHLHYFVNVATGEKMEQGADGDFRVISAANLKIRKQQADTRRAAANAERIKRLPRMRETPSGMHKAIGNFGTMSGTKKGLVILVNFQDKQFNSSNNQAAFDNQFNQTGYNKNGHIGSVKDYFKAQSYGDFSIDFDVVGPVTVSENMAYYGANDASGNDVRPADMIIEAVDLADSECNVDFSQYDWDGDGFIDQVFIIYAGYAEAQGAAANTIWPHEWTISAAKRYSYYNQCPSKDGKIIDTYACTAELCGYSGSTMDGIGTACHEFSHCLGYPDLYDTSSNNPKAWGMSYLDLMASGSYNGPNYNGEVPCGYSAYERWMAGWLEPIELTEPITISGMEPINTTPKAYIIKNTDNEYLLLENRQNNNWFTYPAGHGLLITHVDYDETAWTYNTVNQDPDHQRLTYIPADGTKTSSSFAGDFFAGSSNVTALTSTSHADVGGAWYNGTAAFANMDLTDITETGGKISFKFDGGTPVDDGRRYTITYNVNGETSTWTQTEFREAATLPTIPTNEYIDWTPMGWALSEYYYATSFENVEWLNLLEGDEFIPTEDITLYAVYCDEFRDLYSSRPVEADNTISLSVMGSVSSTWSQERDVDKRIYTLPTPTITNPVKGWEFVGWTTTEIDNSSNQPTIIAAGTQVRPDSDIIYYAVFSHTAESTDDSPKYRLVDSPTADKEYILVTSNVAGSAYAIDFSKINTTAQATIAGTSVNIINNAEYPAIADATGDLRCIFTKTNNNKWYVKHGDNFLAINNSGFLMKSSSSNINWDNTNGLSGESGSGNTKYYVHCSNTGEFSKSQTGSDSNRVYLYENVAGSAVTYYSTSPAVTLHAVTFNAGAGSCGTDSFTQTEETTSTELPTATCSVTGWAFTGWATAAVEMTSTRPAMLNAGESYTPTVNSTLYAVYTATSYEGATATVWYCSNPTAALTNTFYTISLSDGDALWQEPWTQTASAATFTLPTLTEEGWTFFGWSSSPVRETVTTAPAVTAAGVTITPVTNMTLYSVFSREVNEEIRYISNPANYVPYGGTEDPQFVMPHAAYVGQPFHAPAIRTESTGALHFSSSDPAVAEVDEATGKVTIKGAGTAVITVTQDATATHRAATASYTIQVFDNN